MIHNIKKQSLHVRVNTTRGVRRRQNYVCRECLGVSDSELDQ